MIHVIAFLIAVHAAQPPSVKPASPPAAWVHGVASGGGGGTQGQLDFSQAGNPLIIIFGGAL